MPPSEDVPLDDGKNKHVTIPIPPSPDPAQTPEDAKMEMHLFLPQCTTVEANVKKIKHITEEMEKQHKTVLGATNDSERSRSKELLDQYVSSLKQVSAETRVTLRSLNERTEALAPAACSGSGSLRMRKTKQKNLMDKFTKAMKAFKTMQEKYNVKYKDQLARQVRIVNPQVSQEEMDQLLENPEGARAMMFDIGKRKVAQQNLQDMKDRFDDVKKIAESIVELAALFTEMQEMIDMQGENLDRIETSMDNSGGYLDSAAKDLGSAVDSQKSILKKKWIMMALVAFLVLILLFVLAYILKQFGIAKLLNKKSAE